MHLCCSAGLAFPEELQSQDPETRIIKFCCYAQRSLGKHHSCNSFKSGKSSELSVTPWCKFPGWPLMIRATKIEVSILILSSFTTITDSILNQNQKGKTEKEVTEECSQLKSNNKRTKRERWGGKEGESMKKHYNEVSVLWWASSFELHLCWIQCPTCILFPLSALLPWHLNIILIYFTWHTFPCLKNIE